MNYYLYIIFFIAFIWGLSPVLFKFILQKKIPPYIIIFIQAFVYLFSSIIYIILYKNHIIYKDLHLHINYIPYLITISFFSVYIANILYIYALENHVNANIMSLTISLSPIITIIFSYLILQDSINLKTLIGFFLIFIALIIIFTPL